MPKRMFNVYTSFARLLKIASVGDRGKKARDTSHVETSGLPGGTLISRYHRLKRMGNVILPAVLHLLLSPRLIHKALIQQLLTSIKYILELQNFDLQVIFLLLCLHLSI